MDDFGISPVATPGAVAIVRDGCSIRVTQDLSLVSLAARRQPDAVKALGEALGGELPVVGKSATLDGRLISWVGHNQWFIRSTGLGPTELATQVAELVGEHGYVTDQSHGWIEIEASGPATRSVLERLCTLDVDATVFPSGSTARTTAEHLGLQVTCLDDEQSLYLLSSASSSGASLWHAVSVAQESVCGPN